MQAAICWCWSTEESGSQQGCKGRQGYGRASVPVTAEVPDATENLINEFKRVKESEEQVLGVRDELEQLTQKVSIARDEGRLAEEAVLTSNREEESFPRGCCWSRQRSSVLRRTRAILARRVQRARRDLTE